jgi:hypothetical protein
MPENEYHVRVSKCFNPVFRNVDGALVTGEWQPTAEDGFTALHLTRHDDNNPIAEYNRFIDFVSELAPELVDAFIFIENLRNIPTTGGGPEMIGATRAQKAAFDRLYASVMATDEAVERGG